MHGALPRPALFTLRCRLPPEEVRYIVCMAYRVHYALSPLWCSGIRDNLAAKASMMRWDGIAFFIQNSFIASALARAVSTAFTSTRKTPNTHQIIRTDLILSNAFIYASFLSAEYGFFALICNFFFKFLLIRWLNNGDSAFFTQNSSFFEHHTSLK